jgi:acetylxylan esterase
MLAAGLGECRRLGLRRVLLTIDVDNEPFAYPATLQNYLSSAAKGDKPIKSELAADVKRCPKEKFVLVGYSQGAQVVGDALGGGGRTPATKGVRAAIARKIVAVIQMGDPRRVPGRSFDKGTDPGATGVFPRPASESLARFAKRFRSYCDTGDPARAATTSARTWPTPRSTTR